jgi:hypothetical protein
MPRLRRREEGGSGAELTASGVPSATGTPLSIKTESCRRDLDFGGGAPSEKSSRNEFNACPPVTELKIAVNVPLKAKADEGRVSVAQSSVPFTAARTVADGPGSPGQRHLDKSSHC